MKVAYDEFQGTSQTYYIGVGGMFGIFSALTGAFSLSYKCLPRHRSACPEIARLAATFAAAAAAAAAPLRLFPVGRSECAFPQPSDMLGRQGRSDT